MRNFKICILLVTVLITTFSIFSCGASDENLKDSIIGSWVLTEDSEPSFSDDYPSKEITFESNGRCQIGGYLGQYYIENDIIVMDCNNWFYEREYKISIKDGLLKLQYRGYSPVYYERIN